MGIGGLLVLLVLSFVFGRDFVSGGGVPETGTGSAGGEVAPVRASPEEEELVEFVNFVLNDVQATWDTILPRLGTPYQEAKLVLFRDAVQSACGVAPAESGPFYCPLDQKVYLDLSFFEELDRRFGAPGDFAQAYVIAHELGHHVQNLTGVAARVRQLQEARPGQANALSVRLELQADCYAGVWGHTTSQRRLLEQGDVEEGLNAASAIGDDRLMRQAGGEVQPESFTHGTSAQRVGWFRRGMERGDPEACDTFASDR
jgi:hypothetical protein